MIRKLAFVLAVLLLLSCIGCTQAPAVEDTKATQPTIAPTEPSEPAPTVPENVTYTDVSDAQQLHDALEAGLSVRLAENISLDNAQHDMRIENKKDIYFDLNGKKLTINNSVKKHAINLISSTMTVLDGSAAKTGEVRALYCGEDAAVFRVNGEDIASSLTVLSGTYLYRAATASDGKAISYLIHSNGDVIIYDGIFDSSVATTPLYGYAGTVTINGGRFRANVVTKEPCVLTTRDDLALVDLAGGRWFELYRRSDTVADPISWETLNAIPIANDTMTEEELRQICVDFMRLQLSFSWTPSHDFTYKNHSKYITLYRGSVYGGLPYISSTGGNLYNALEYYDPATGTIDTKTAGANFYKMIGNQCSGAAFWAWARISDKIAYSGTKEMLERYGCLRLGSYKYDDNIQNFHDEKIRTADICKGNGKQVMYESYALFKKADGMVLYTGSAGHTRMIATDAVVVRNADGTIDGDASYVTYLDQVSEWKEETQSNGDLILVQGGLDVKSTFAELYGEGYLPFRIPELAGKDPVDKATATISHTGSSINLDQLCRAAVTSNYAISDVTLTLKNAQGEILYDKTKTTDNITTKSVELFGDLATAKLQEYMKNGEVTVQITARVGTGQKLVVYTGALAGN